MRCFFSVRSLAFVAILVAAVATPERSIAQALWAQSDQTDALTWPGRRNDIEGDVHSNGDIEFTGFRNGIIGATTYVGTLTNPYTSGNSKNDFDPAAQQTTIRAWPLNLDVADYAPGSAAAIAAGANYFDLTSQCTTTSNKVVFQYDDVTLTPGIYYADCGFYIRLDNVSGSVTFASSESIDISLKNDTNISAYVDATLMITDSDQTDAIVLNGSYSHLEGRMIAESGTIEVKGSLHDFNCGIFADKIALTGSKHDMFATCPLLQNFPPVAVDDLADTYVEQLVAIDVLANDSDSDGSLDATSIVVTAAPVNGTATVSAGMVNYTPAVGFVGSEFFDYTVNDDDGAVSNVATIRVEVSVPNNPPVLGADSFTTAEDTSAVLDILANDVDAESAIDVGSLVITLAPTNGSLTFDEVAAVADYTPDANFSGTDQFEYHVADDEGLFADPVQVTITVQSVNDAPTASDETVVTDEDQSVVVSLIAADVEGDTLTLNIESQPASGTLSGSFPDITYAPNQDFSGADSFTFSVTDGSLSSNVATVTITVNPVNDVPVATALSTNVAEDGTVSITLAGTDADGDVLSFAVATTPNNGTLSGLAPTLVYTPNPNYFGSDSFSFTADDGTVSSTAATVSIAVDAVNDIPIAFPQSLTTDEDTSIGVMLMGQ
ncbi:MAG: Ig-like domain-containing protein [Pseudomonadota bacterium]